MPAPDLLFTAMDIELLLGGIAAVAAGFFTNPLEVVKIRMQLQGELQTKGKYAVHYRNVFHAAYTIARRDGLLALQKGLVPALGYQFVMNGLRLGVYHWCDKQGLTRNPHGLVDPFRSAMVASISGCIGGSVGTPLFLVKTHLQSKANEKAIAVGHQHAHTGMFRAFESIYKQYGVMGLCRGVSSSLPRIVVASAVQISTYEKSVEFIKAEHIIPQDSIMNSFGGSLIAGFFVAIAMAPFDLISTRFYNQGVDARGKGLVYTSVFDCGRKIYEKEGFLGFYKGWTANYFRIGPHTLLTFVFWDRLRHYYKISHDANGNPPPPE